MPISLEPETLRPTVKLFDLGVIGQYAMQVSFLQTRHRPRLVPFAAAFRLVTTPLEVSNLRLSQRPSPDQEPPGISPNISFGS